jgi:hypothetical protein
VQHIVFGRFCYMCVLCQVYVEPTLSFVYFYGLDNSLYRILNVRPVCHMYLSGHLLSFNWYSPLWLYLSIVPSWFKIESYCISSSEKPPMWMRGRILPP